MAKMVITLVVDADRNAARKIKERILYAAHKHLVSCSAHLLDNRDETKPEPGRRWPFDVEV